MTTKEPFNITSHCSIYDAKLEQVRWAKVAKRNSENAMLFAQRLFITLAHEPKETPI